MGSEELPKRTFNPHIEAKLRREDYNRVDELAKLEGRTKAEVVREAVLWYLDNRDDIRNEKRDTITGRSIDVMTNRICAMLARQGRLTATMFELTYANLSQTKEGKEAFEVALTRAKQKMAQSVEKDERDVADSMKRTAKA